jgi:Tripartite tricarboxylate transporter TctB family
MSLRNLIAALLTIAIGAAALLEASRYPLGTLRRMGPGYFPDLLGVVLIGFGAVLLLQAFRAGPAAADPFVLRPVLAIPFGILLFALLLERLGLGPAVLALVGVSLLAEPVFHLRRALALAAATSALTYVLFIVILRLPFAFLTW